MTYTRREALVGGLALLAGCKTMNSAKQDAGKVWDTITATASGGYDKFIEPFLEKTNARYIAHQDGATITYNGESGKITVVDGSERKLDVPTRFSLSVLDFFGSEVIKYDGIPDKVTINANDGTVSIFDHGNGIEDLVTIARETKRITEGIGRYFGMFANAIVNGDIDFEESKDRNSYGVVARARNHVITARDVNHDGTTDYFKVVREDLSGSTLVAEITGTPDIFEGPMKDLVANARLALAERSSQKILNKVR